MSKYLIRRLDHAKITKKEHTEIVALEGGDHLERVTFRDNRHRRADELRLPQRVSDDRRGTRPPAGSTAASRSTTRASSRPARRSRPTISPPPRWPLERDPHLFETTLPGVFAVGDVRAGNIKRVASAVGEGSIAVSFVHQVLSE